MAETEKPPPAPHAPRSAQSEEQVAQQTRRGMLLQFAVRINHQISLLAHKGNPSDARQLDEKGKPIISLSEITSAIKMLCVELRHEYPIAIGDESDLDAPALSNDDPLAALVLKFPSVESVSKSKTAKAPKRKQKRQA
jgi:hypothetical protein